MVRTSGRTVKAPVKYQDEFAEPPPPKKKTTRKTTTTRAAPKKAAPKKAATKKTAPKKTAPKKTTTKKTASKKPAASKGKKRARDDEHEDEDEIPDEDADISAEGDGESSPKRARTGDGGGEEEVQGDGPAEGDAGPGDDDQPEFEPDDEAELPAEFTAPAEDEGLPDVNEEPPKDKAAAPTTPAPATTHDPRLGSSGGFSGPDMEGTPADLTTTARQPAATSPTYPNRGSPTRPDAAPSSDPLESPRYERDPEHTEMVGRPFVELSSSQAKSPTGLAKSPTGSAKSPTGSSPAVPPRSGDRVGQRTRSGPAAAQAGRDVGYDDFGDSIFGPAGSSPARPTTDLFGQRSRSGPAASTTASRDVEYARMALADPYLSSRDRASLLRRYPDLAPPSPELSTEEPAIDYEAIFTGPRAVFVDPDAVVPDSTLPPEVRGLGGLLEHKASDTTITADASRTSLFGESVRGTLPTSNEGTSGIPDGPPDHGTGDTTIPADASRTSLFGESPRTGPRVVERDTRGNAPRRTLDYYRDNNDDEDDEDDKDADDPTLEPDTSAFVPSPGATFVDETTNETGINQGAAKDDSTTQPEGATELPEDDTAEDVTSTLFLVGAIEREIDQATMFEPGDGTAGTTPGRTSTAPATTARTPTARTPTARSPILRSPTARRPLGRRPSSRRPSTRTPTTARPRSPLAASPPMTHVTLANEPTTAAPTTNAAFGDDADEEDVDSTSFLVGRIEETIAQGDFGDHAADQAPAPPAPPVTPPRPIVRDRDGKLYSGSPTDSQYELMEPALDAIYDESTPPRRRGPPLPSVQPATPPVVPPTVQPAVQPAAPATEEATETYSPTVESSQDEAEAPESTAQSFRRPGLPRAPSSTQPARDVGPPSASGLAHDESESRDGPRVPPRNAQDNWSRVVERDSQRAGLGEVPRPSARTAATAFTSMWEQLGFRPDDGEVAGPPPTYPTYSAPPTAGHGRSLAEELEANRALLSGLGGTGGEVDEDEGGERRESEEPEEQPAEPDHEASPDDDDEDDGGSLFNDTDAELREMGLSNTPKNFKFK